MRSMNTTHINEDLARIDWEERKTARMIRDAKQTGFFDSIIDDAKQQQVEHGYSWVVALRVSMNYWATDGVTPYRV